MSDRPSASVRTVAASWRRLTGGRAVRDPHRRTLVAASGGADSSALLIALATTAAPGSIVAGHVVHDLRSAEQSHADRDAARLLAEKLNVPFVETQVRARAEKGNVEEAARRLRYAALGKLAREQGCGFVATAHHADDQLETLLMRLLRGAGPAGLGGIRSRRPIDALDPRVLLIRPMLPITHSEAIDICTSFGWAWREDATNLDTTRLRSALRHRVLPILRELKPGAPARAVATAELCGRAWSLVRSASVELLGDATRHQGAVLIPRHLLRSCPRIVATEALREAILEASGGAARDRITQRSLGSAARAICRASGEAKEFHWKGATLLLRGDEVRVEPRSEDRGPKTP